MLPGWQYWKKAGGLKSFRLILLLPEKFLEEYSSKIDYLLNFKTKMNTSCTFSTANTACLIVHVSFTCLLFEGLGSASVSFKMCGACNALHAVDFWTWKTYE